MEQDRSTGIGAASLLALACKLRAMHSAAHDAVDPAVAVVANNTAAR